MINYMKQRTVWLHQKFINKDQGMEQFITRFEDSAAGALQAARTQSYRKSGSAERKRKSPVQPEVRRRCCLPLGKRKNVWFIYNIILNSSKPLFVKCFDSMDGISHVGLPNILDYKELSCSLRTYLALPIFFIQDSHLCTAQLLLWVVIGKIIQRYKCIEYKKYLVNLP